LHEIIFDKIQFSHFHKNYHICDPHMYAFIDEIWKTNLMDNHTSTWSTNPENFMRFGNGRCKRGWDPMEIPIYTLKKLGICYYRKLFQKEFPNGSETLKEFPIVTYTQFFKRVYTLKKNSFFPNPSKRFCRCQKASKWVEMPKETIKKFYET
jgi:hypothetical protein